jgi:hypothetical protein
MCRQPSCLADPQKLLSPSDPSQVAADFDPSLVSVLVDVSHCTGFHIGQQNIVRVLQPIEML